MEQLKSNDDTTPLQWCDNCEGMKILNQFSAKKLTEILSGLIDGKYPLLARYPMLSVCIYLQNRISALKNGEAVTTSPYQDEICNQGLTTIQAENTRTVTVVRATHTDQVAVAQDHPLKYKTDVFRRMLCLAVEAVLVVQKGKLKRTANFSAPHACLEHIWSVKTVQVATVVGMQFLEGETLKPTSIADVCNAMPLKDLYQCWQSIAATFPTAIGTAPITIGKREWTLPTSVDVKCPDTSVKLQTLHKIYERTMAPVKSVRVGFGLNATRHVTGLSLSPGLYKSFVQYQDVRAVMPITYLYGTTLAAARALLHKSERLGKRTLFVRRTSVLGLTSYSEFVTIQKGHVTAITKSGLISGSGIIPVNGVKVAIIDLTPPVVKHVGKGIYANVVNDVKAEDKRKSLTNMKCDYRQRYVSYLSVAEGGTYSPSLHSQLGYVIEHTGGSWQVDRLLRYMIVFTRRSIAYTYTGMITRKFRIGGDDPVEVGLDDFDFANLTVDQTTDAKEIENMEFIKDGLDKLAEVIDETTEQQNAPKKEEETPVIDFSNMGLDIADDEEEEEEED